MKTNFSVPKRAVVSAVATIALLFWTGTAVLLHVKIKYNAWPFTANPTWNSLLFGHVIPWHQITLWLVLAITTSAMCVSLFKHEGNSIFVNVFASLQLICSVLVIITESFGHSYFALFFTALAVFFSGCVLKF